MEDSFNDSKYYIHVDDNHLEQLIDETKEFFDSWSYVFESDDVFDKIDLKVKNTTLPRAYGLIKIHKPDLPVRIIVSSCC